MQTNPRSATWHPKDCNNCPVPDILQANSSPDLVLEGYIDKGFLGFNRQVKVKAFCSRHLIDVPQPHVGCRECARERPGFQQLFGE